MSDPSILTYARYFNLTQDHTLDDPVDALDTILAQPDRPGSLPESDESIQRLTRKFEIAAEEYLSLANDEPLLISQDATRYLKSSTSYDIENLNKIYNELLPDPYRLRRLKFDIPLLVIGGGDVAKDIRRIRQSVDLKRILNDFLEDLNDEKDPAQRDESFVSSTLSAEILEWSQNQFERTVKEEKIDINRNALKYLEEALSTAISFVDMQKTMQGLLPQVQTFASHDNHFISEDDFDIEIEDEPIDFEDALESAELNFEDLPPAVKQDLDLLGRLDAAVDEEYFLDSTQAERDMNELFRQFTHQGSEPQCNSANIKVISDSPGQLPAAKKRKLSHIVSDKLVAKPDEAADIHNLKLGLGDLKINAPETLGNAPFELLSLELPCLLGQKDKADLLDSITLDSGNPPFQIPTIHEAICQSMPPISRVYEKFLVEEKTVVSSDMLLWKEPGLRVLDHDELDEQDLVAENYDIEDNEQDKLIKEEPESVQYPEVTSSSARHDHAAALRKSSADRRDNSKPTSTPSKQHLADIARSKEEDKSPNENASTVSSDIVHAGPSALATSCVLPGLRGELESTIDRQQSNSIAMLQDSHNSPSILSSSESIQSIIDNEFASMKSLLPISKRRHPSQEIAAKSEHKFNDSLASFLDLRGKQFKFPVVKQASKTADIVEDPIQLTQDSYVKQSPSAEYTLVPSPPPSDKTIQQEAVPSTTPLHEPRTIVVNSTLLQTKPLLIQFLESPDEHNLTLIYRDLDTRQYRGPDLILNATTCLIITNLQSLNQRALPGQKSATGLSSAHDQVALLTPSYSQVVVLVHHVLSTDLTLQSKAVTAQAAFSAFCQNLSRTSSARTVQSYWVTCVDPTSTSKVVNAWVWQFISCHAHRDESLAAVQTAQPALSTLIQDETLWEVFLCKAGLNPMAAQLVLGSLKKIDVRGQTCMKEPTWGLRRLVAMGSQERVRLFAEVIGLDVVKRLNEVFSGTSRTKYTI